MKLAAAVLAFPAGLLSILSPCVLPLVPIVVGTAVSRHRLGAIALATGLTVSFLMVGLFVATIGIALGVDDDVFRSTGAVLLVVLGGALLIPSSQTRLALLAQPAGDWAERQFSSWTNGGLSGQFCIGLVLGIVWSPCFGPTLGTASVLASQGRDLGQAALTMLLFASGAVLPLVVVGLLSRQALSRWRGRMLTSGNIGRAVLGVILVASGLLVISGGDRTVEAALLSISPPWLTDLATRF